jgi:hypothetical protein
LESGDSVAKELDAFADKLDALHKTLVATREGAITGEEQLRERIVELYGWVTQFGGRPTQSVLDRIPVLEKEIDGANAAFEAIIGKELAGVNSKLASKRLDSIRVMTREEYDRKHEK